MFRFNGYLDTAHALFKRKQTHWFGLYLENEMYSDWLFETIQLYKNQRSEFMGRISESLFELSSLRARTAFYTFLMLGEHYVNLLNPNMNVKFFSELVKALFFIKKIDSFDNVEESNNELIKIAVNMVGSIEQDFKRHDKTFFFKHLNNLQLAEHNQNTNIIERFYLDFICEINLQTFRFDLVEGNRIVALNGQIIFPLLFVPSIIYPRNHPDALDVEVIPIGSFMATFLSNTQEEKVKRISKSINNYTDVMFSSWGPTDGDKRGMLH